MPVLRDDVPCPPRIFLDAPGIVRGFSARCFFTFFAEDDDLAMDGDSAFDGGGVVGPTLAGAPIGELVGAVFAGVADFTVFSTLGLAFGLGFGLG